ncbi:isochorismatase family protein [Neobacillus dielmonensis]|uniref:isochorismatase family protein n=1 Tax=Neobacillus dielmonensis TaxID=1347369 RepID=UPI0005A7D1A9|nr:isochorismatase family protein [Neobacillus dielmonensis]
MNEKKTALLLIDLQVGPLYGVYKREETLTVIQSMIKKAEEENMPILYIQHEEQPGGFLERGTPFWQFAEGFTPKASDYVIHKQSTDSFFETSLHQELTTLGITNLLVAGVRTEYCVDTTCRRAITLGYDVTLLADGHTTADGAIPAELIIQHHNHNLSTVKTTANHITIAPYKELSLNTLQR